MKFSKNNIAISIALLFHISGTVGILFTPYKNWFIQNTPINLCLMAALLFYTQIKINKAFIAFVCVSFTVGMATEIIGVNTGYLFGNYWYTNTMGYKIFNVPLLIGVQWFVTIFCCGIAVNQLHDWLQKKYEIQGLMISPKIQFLSLIIDGALLATFFDFIMEPIAIHLNYWQWQNNAIPFYNYACWFIISLLLLVAFRFLPFNKHNQFAIHLLIIQSLFFLILRNFM